MENSDEESENSNSSETPKKKRKKRKFSDSSDAISEKDNKNLSNGKGEDSDPDKSVNKLLLKKGKEKEILKDIEKPKLYESIIISGFPMIQREDLKDYVNSRIFYTIKEMQLVKSKITKGKKKHSRLFRFIIPCFC
jgi:hypothetical protein